MFKLQPNPTFEADVAIHVPGSSPANITFVFKHMGKKAFREFFEGLTDDKQDKDDADVVCEFTVGWKNVDVEFNKEHLAQLLDAYPSAALALLDAYRRELFEAKVKN